MLLTGLLSTLAAANALGETEWRNLNGSRSQLEWPVARAARLPGDSSWHVLMAGNDAALVRTDGVRVETVRWLPPASAHRWLPAGPGKLAFVAEHDDGPRYWVVEGGQARLVTGDRRPADVAAFGPRWPVVYRQDSGRIEYIDAAHVSHEIGGLAPQRETRVTVAENGSVLLFQPGATALNLYVTYPDGIVGEAYAVPDLQDVLPLGDGWLTLEGAPGRVVLRGLGREPRVVVDAEGAVALFSGPRANLAVSRDRRGNFVLFDPVLGGEVVLPTDPARPARAGSAEDLVVFVVDEADGSTVYTHDYSTGSVSEVGRAPAGCAGAPLRALEPAAVWLECGASWYRVDREGVAPAVRAEQFVLPFDGEVGAVGYTPRVDLEIDPGPGGPARTVPLRRMENSGSYPRFFAGGAVLALRRFETILFGGLPGPLERRAQLTGVVFESEDLIAELDEQGRLLARIRVSDGARLGTPGLPEGAVLIAPLAGGALVGPGRRPTHWVPAEGPAVALQGDDIPPVSGLSASQGRRFVYNVLDRPGLWVVDLDAAEVLALAVPGEPDRLAIFGEWVVTASSNGVWLAGARPGGVAERISNEAGRLLGVDDAQAFLLLGSPPHATLRIDGRSGERTTLPPLDPLARRFLAYRGGLLYVAPTLEHGFEPHYWAGAAEAPIRLGDLFEGPFSSEARWVRALDGRVYFTAESVEEGREYAVTDGTAAGTRWLPPAVPGPASGAPHDFTGAVAQMPDGRLALAALHPEDSVEVALVDPNPVTAADGGVPDVGNADAGPSADAGPRQGLDRGDSSCGCRTPPDPARRGAPWLSLVLLAGALLARGRASRVDTC